MKTLSIDLETYSSTPIKYGVHKYSEADDFEILLFGYAYDMETPTVVDLASGERIPTSVLDDLRNPSVLKTAFNANFEITCLNRFIETKTPADQWMCSSVLSLYNGYPTGLANVAEVMPLGDEVKKDARGKNLIRYFSIPCKPTKANGGRTRNYPDDAPEQWKLYKEYNRQDVVVEQHIVRKLLNYLPPVTEHKLWVVDNRINNAGVKVNKTLVDNAIRYSNEYCAELLEESSRISGLDNPNSIVQLSEWLTSRLGSYIDKVRKADVVDLLKRDDIPDDVRQVLKNRQQLSKASVAKYQAMENTMSVDDDRIRDLFQFYGASRTGRWAGRNVQLQNLPRNYLEDLDEARNMVLAGDLDVFKAKYDVQFTISELIRTALEAEDGSRFIVADFSAIEARVIAWLAGETWRQEVFAEGGDIYCSSASKMFHVPVVKHGVNGHLRQKGKVAELALGYGGTTQALINMGALDGGIKEEELPEIVAKWREASPRIVQFWNDADNAAKRAVSGKGVQTIVQGGIKFALHAGALMIRLPSGRRLTYLRARMGENRWGQPAVTHMGLGIGKWERQETYGGKLVENIVQAVARDCLGEAMIRLDAAGYKIVAHVHDEVIIEAPKGFGSLDDVIRIMTETPAWADGLILNAAGFESPYYMKD
jgi:DNA polymerase